MLRYLKNKYSKSITYLQSILNKCLVFINDKLHEINIFNQTSNIIYIHKNIVDKTKFVNKIMKVLMFLHKKSLKNYKEALQQNIRQIP